MTKRLSVMILLIGLFLMSFQLVTAQTPLIVGKAVTTTLNSATSQQLYSFSVDVDSVITLYALGSIQTLTPTLALSGPRGQIAFSDRDPLTPLMNDSRITYRLEQPGIYSVLVSSIDGTEGSLTLVLNIEPMVEANVLEGEAIVSVVAGSDPVAYVIPANPDMSLILELASLTEGFEFAGWLSAPDGQLLSVIDGGIPLATFTLPATEGNYLLRVGGAELESEGDLRIAIVGSSENGGVQSPIATEEAGSVAPPADICAVVAPGSVNIRSGAGTNFTAIGSLSAGDFAEVIGQNAGWYAINYNGQTGWVFGDVVRITGDCSAVPTLPSSAPGAVTLAPTVQGAPPTNAPTLAPGAPTATLTLPTATLIPTLIPTATQVGQIAPPDADYQFNINRDRGGVFTEVISYPNGDTQDRITTMLNLDSINTSREVSITLSCNGIGTQFVTFHRGSPTAQAFTCGQTITYRYSTPTLSQPYYVILSGGEGSYVTYTLNATTQP